MKLFSSFKKRTTEDRPENPAGAQLRCFAALDCPAEWKSELARLQDDLKRTLSSRCFRWVQPDQMHLTVRFFGSVTPEAAEELQGVLAKIPSTLDKTEPLVLEAKQLGVFPRPKSPRVLWLGLDASPALAHLHEMVTEVTAQFGQPPESRPFKPHLTLARINEPSCVEVEKVHMALNSLSTWSADPWEVKELTLFRSQLSPQGPKYTKLLEVPL